MIRSFANKQTEDVFHGTNAQETLKSFTPKVLKLAEERLDLLNGVDSCESLNQIPSIGSNIVRGPDGKHSIPLEDNCRLCFRCDKNGPSDVEIKSQGT